MVEDVGAEPRLAGRRLALERERPVLDTGRLGDEPRRLEQLLLVRVAARSRMRAGSECAVKTTCASVPRISAASSSTKPGSSCQLSTKREARRGRRALARAARGSPGSRAPSSAARARAPAIVSAPVASAGLGCVGDARRPVLHAREDRQPELALERGARLLGDRVQRRRVLDPEAAVALDEVVEVLGRDRPPAADVGVVGRHVREPLRRAVRHQDDRFAHESEASRSRKSIVASHAGFSPRRSHESRSAPFRARTRSARRPRRMRRQDPRGSRTTPQPQRRPPARPETPRPRSRRRRARPRRGPPGEAAYAQSITTPPSSTFAGCRSWWQSVGGIASRRARTSSPSVTAWRSRYCRSQPRDEPCVLGRRERLRFPTRRATSPRRAGVQRTTSGRSRARGATEPSSRSTSARHAGVAEWRSHPRLVDARLAAPVVRMPRIGRRRPARPCAAVDDHPFGTALSDAVDACERPAVVAGAVFRSSPATAADVPKTSSSSPGGISLRRAPQRCVPARARRAASGGPDPFAAGRRGRG